MLCVCDVGDVCGVGVGVGAGPSEDCELLAGRVMLRHEEVDGQSFQVLSIRRPQEVKHIETLLTRCVSRMHVLFSLGPGMFAW